MSAQEMMRRFVIHLAGDSEEGEEFVATKDGEGIGVEINDLRRRCED